mmetsp:Transcript_61/g.142  ORF Transcript_61/g.142 Transcript_61/m.142 type:complete len:203 (-) Transcript_61:947-1555(-)
MPSPGHQASLPSSHWPPRQVRTHVHGLVKHMAQLFLHCIRVGYVLTSRMSKVQRHDVLIDRPPLRNASSEHEHVPHDVGHVELGQEEGYPPCVEDPPYYQPEDALLGHVAREVIEADQHAPSHEHVHHQRQLHFPGEFEEFDDEPQHATNPLEVEKGQAPVIVRESQHQYWSVSPGYEQIYCAVVQSLKDPIGGFAAEEGVI